MKKIKIGTIVILAVLVFCLIAAGCKPEDLTDNPIGKVLILQAYGNAGETDAPAGVSHSFVELYNITDKEVDLTGTTLWFADGKRYNVSESAPLTDGEWKSIKLSGKLPAKTSLFILGKKHDAANSSVTRYMIPDNSGDINNDALALYRRGFKVALIYGSNELGVNYQNPFTDGQGGKPISGYIDMVGAVNNPNESEQGNKDQILGFETAPARNSASVAVRRIDLEDYNDNSTDFEEIRYADFSNAEIEIYKPRKKSDGKWNPVIAEPPIPDLTNVDYSKLRLNEISGEHKFVEIYNTGSAAIPLYNLKLQRNGGTENSGSEWLGKAGDVIPAGAYRIFLFNSYTPDLIQNPAYTGWRVDSGISDQQILKVALVKPDDTVIDSFTRGNNPVPAFGTTSNVERNRVQSYSRMSDGSWAYADPTPGAANGAKVKDINFPGYLTNTRTNPPIISVLSKDVPVPTESADVTVSATVTNADSVVLKWTLDGAAQTDINMTNGGSGDVYTGTITKQANNKIIVYTVVATKGSEITAISDGYTVMDLSSVDYSPLILTEVSGEHKYVEIYNSGAVDIPMVGVKIDRNDGNSAWTGGAADIIPAGAYRIILFNSYSPTASAAYSGTSTLVNKTKGLETYDEYVGWTVSSGISDQQILKIAIIKPDGTEISIFIRGDAPLPALATNIDAAGRVRTHSYSRMSDGTWAYAIPTPGAENGAKVSDIENPGYLTAQP